MSFLYANHWPRNRGICQERLHSPSSYVTSPSLANGSCVSRSLAQAGNKTHTSLLNHIFPRVPKVKGQPSRQFMSISAACHSLSTANFHSNFHLVHLPSPSFLSPSYKLNYKRRSRCARGSCATTSLRMNTSYYV